MMIYKPLWLGFLSGKLFRISILVFVLGNVFITCKTNHYSQEKSTAKIDQKHHSEMAIHPKGKGFFVCDGKKNKLTDAKVTINGREIPFDDKFYQYCLVEEVPLPCTLEIKHPDHPTFFSDRFYFDTQHIYLFDEEAPAYWHGGVRVPVHKTENQYLLILNNHNTSIEALNNTDKELEFLLRNWSGKVQHVHIEDKMGSILYWTVSFPGQSLTPNTKRKAIEQTMYEYSSTQLFATQFKEFDQLEGLPFGLTKKLEIKLIPKTDAKVVNKILNDFNLKELNRFNEGKNLVIEVELNTDTSEAIIEKTKLLNKNKDTQYANNQIFSLESHY